MFTYISFCYEYIFADFNSYSLRRELEETEVEGYNIGQYMKNANFFDRIESSDFSTTRKKRVVEACLTIWKRI